MLAAMTNTLTKGLLSASIGGRSLATKILVPVAFALAGGAIVLWKD